MSQIDTSKFNVSIIITIYCVLNHFCELRWILPAEVKSTLELENVLANFQHPSTVQLWKPTKTREALQILNIMTTELPAFRLLGRILQLGVI